MIRTLRKNGKSIKTRIFIAKIKNTLTNIESIPRITNLAEVHTYKEQRLRRSLQLVTK